MHSLQINYDIEFKVTTNITIIVNINANNPVDAITQSLKQLKNINIEIELHSDVNIRIKK